MADKRAATSVRKPRIKRRKFLTAAVATASCGALSSCGPGGGGPHWRFFTAAEAATVTAICGRIIPKDDFPGAAEAGALNFIDLQLTRHNKRHQPAYRQGLAQVEQEAQRRFRRGFAQLGEEEQDEILRQVEEKSPEFFGLIRAHTMQGYYGDPRHGGNRNAVSWKMLGLPDPPVRGRLPYERKGS